MHCIEYERFIVHTLRTRSMANCKLQMMFVATLTLYGKKYTLRSCVNSSTSKIYTDFHFTLQHVFYMSAKTTAAQSKVERVADRSHTFFSDGSVQSCYIIIIIIVTYYHHLPCDCTIFTLNIYHSPNISSFAVCKKERGTILQ